MLPSPDAVPRVPAREPGPLGAALRPDAAVAVFLMLGLVAGLTESAERAMVARLAPVRTGKGFGLYHALTGAAALPAGLLFGWLVASPRTHERQSA